VGIAFRAESFDEVARNLDCVDVLEVTAEHYVYGSRRVRAMIEDLARSVPIVAHGVALSVGTALEPDRTFLRDVRAFLAAVRAPWYSEHLAFTKTPRFDLSQLMPLPRTAEMIRILCENLEIVKRQTGVPLLLENISYYFEYPHAEMSEREFLLGVALASGCRLLLDVENVRINAENHGYDAVAFVRALPPGIVRAVHVAGGQRQRGLELDSHDRPVSPATLALLAETLRRQRPETIVVERDRNCGDMREVFADVRHIRALLARDRPAPDRRREVLELEDAVLRAMSEPGALGEDARSELGPGVVERLALVGELAAAKRLAKIEAALPLTCAALGAAYAELAREFAADHPARSSRNRANALSFYRFLRRRARTTSRLPRHVVDLASCELALTARVGARTMRGPEWRRSAAGIAVRRAPGARVRTYAWNIRPLLEGARDASVERRRIRVAIVADPVHGEPRVLGLSEKAYELLRTLRGWTPLEAPDDVASLPTLRELATLGVIEIAERASMSGCSGSLASRRASARRRAGREPPM
jgi:uncharacterized protein (UPF0276 family)